MVHARSDPHAAQRLLPLVYDELRQLAAEKMAQEKPGQTLQAIARVHEAYLRLVNQEQAQQSNHTVRLLTPAGHISSILMERHAEDKPSARGDWASAVLDRLQSYDTARAHEAVTSAEQHCIAETEHDFPAARLSSFGRIAEQELAPLEALWVRVLRVGTRAQHHSHLDREEDGATQIAVKSIESSGAELQQDRRRALLARVMTPVAEGVLLLGKGLRVSQHTLPFVGDPGHVRKNGAAKLVHHLWYRCAEITVDTLAEFRPVQDNGIGEKPFVVEQTA